MAPDYRNAPGGVYPMLLRHFGAFALVLCLALPAAGQESVPTLPPVSSDREEAASAGNPLAELNEEVQQALAAAGVPFSTEQERAIALMMEERRRASEDLFGDLMNFRSGPTQGQEEDRLRSAIEWLRAEFLRSLGDYLTETQAAAWARHREVASRVTAEASRAARSEETQYVRINNNTFTAENNGYGSGGSTDVIQRGGAGAWHGRAQFLLKDDALNARNAFASNKPPYQERRVSLDVSGPSIPGRLSSGFSFEQTESENVGTVRATLPDGVFALGITRPNTYREIELRNTLQAASAHSIRTFLRRATEASRDQGIGDFTLPERRYESQEVEWNVGLFPFSMLSSRSIHEARFQLNARADDTLPFSDAVRINVLDAFNGGGAQNRSEERNRHYEFGNLFTRVGDVITVKTGVEGSYRHQRSHSTSNFNGTFTFSSLDAFRAGRPLTYRVTRGNPLLEFGQLEMGTFVQTDVSVGPQLVLMFGARYEAQHNLRDYNNLAPRFALAYAPGQDTVIRAGGGISHSRLTTGMVENQMRFDGTRQFEIVIDEPSYPDPFAAGTIRQTRPSVRTTDAGLVAPYVAVGMLTLERTFLSNLLFTATYDLVREYHKLRTRNLNSPFDARFEELRACTPETPDDACVRPFPDRGNIISLESAGRDIRHTLRLSVRKRFSIFNGSLNYTALRVRGDVQGGGGTLSSNAWDPGADWGRSPQATHSINAGLNASLPLGLFLSGDLAYNSGRYYTITTGRDDNRDSNVNDRPPGVAFNTERGPRYFNVDFNVSKAFFLRRPPGSTTSGTNVNVFVNLTNAFNRVHYGTPSGVLTSPNFGRSTSASDPREIEIGVRFQF
jgi:hypothetical protein